MVAAIKWNEARTGNCSREETTFLKWNSRFVATMQHQRGDFHLWQKIDHVDVAHFSQKPDRVLGRGGNALEVIERLRLLRGCVGCVERSPKLPKRWIVLAPTQLNEGELRLSLLDLFR